MKIVTCASYFCSGASAVTDLLSEYNNIKSLTNYEFRFAHDPDGLSELEYNLVENFNRHNSGHALKRYKKFVDYYSSHLFTKRYEPFFDNKWKELSYKYIESLTDFSFPGYWDFDFYDKGPFYEFWCKLPLRILRKTIWRQYPDKELRFPKNITTLASHPSEEKFLKCTKEYTDSLMKAANKENKPILMVDQIVPSSNIKRHVRYFNNIQVVLVDRDPRDVYLLSKYDWHSTIVPEDIDTFCKWFAYNRDTQKTEIANKEVLFIHFEDLVYKYEKTRDKIISWLGLDESMHVEPKKFFNPDISVKNTRFWEQHPEYKADADYIAEKLPQFLYNL